MNITILQGHELYSFLTYLGVDDVPATGIYILRINQREDGIAYKINSGTWSPTIGRRADAGGH